MKKDSDDNIQNDKINIISSDISYCINENNSSNETAAIAIEVNTNKSISKHINTTEIMLMMSQEEQDTKSDRNINLVTNVNEEYKDIHTIPNDIIVIMPQEEEHDIKSDHNPTLDTNANTEYKDINTKPNKMIVVMPQEVGDTKNYHNTKLVTTTNKEYKDIYSEPNEIIVMMSQEDRNTKNKHSTTFSNIATTYNIETQRDADAGKKVYYDEETESPLVYESGNRNDFVRKVCAITFIMLAVTAGFIIFVINNEDMKEFFEINRLVLLIPALVIALSINYAMFCSNCTRKPPCNFICLIINTIAYCILAAVISVKYKTEILFYAFLTTAILVFICILLALSKFDFTSWLLYVIGLTVVVSVIALSLFLVQLTTDTRWKPVQIGLLLVMTLLQSVMLIIELQMILGGRQVELGEYDYALGAFMLYNSIMELFLKIVQILGLIDSS